MPTYKMIFKKSKLEDPSNSLFERIIKNIEMEKNFIILRNKIILISIGAIFSIVLFVFSIILIKNEAVKSGFVSFFSLIFSDFSVITKNWNSFVISLLETIPIMNIVLMIFSGMITIFSLKIFSRGLQIFNNYKQHNNYIN